MLTPMTIARIVVAAMITHRRSLPATAGLVPGTELFTAHRLSRPDIIITIIHT
jgi:hypothetical protein